MAKNIIINFYTRKKVFKIIEQRAKEEECSPTVLINRILKEKINLWKDKEK